MNMDCRKRYILGLTACSGAALMTAANGACAQISKPASNRGATAERVDTRVATPVPSGPLHPVPPVVAPPNCANGFSQTSVTGQPGGAQFGFSCQYQVTCPPGPEYLKSIVQVSGVATGPTAATFTYGCSYLNVSTQRK